MGFFLQVFVRSSGLFFIKRMDKQSHTMKPYERFLAQQAEILRHKWLESQKAGRDIGFETASSDWRANHGGSWLGHCRELLKDGSAPRRTASR